MMRKPCLAFFLLLWLCGSAQKNTTLEKVSPALFEKLKAMKEADSVDVSISFGEQPSITAKKLSLREKYAKARIFRARIAKADILLLAGQGEVLFINEHYLPKEELSTGATDFTLNKINKAHSAFPGIKGEGIRISIKERAFDTSDIDLKGRVFSSGVEAAAPTVHAAMMATIIAGGGNSSPYALGVAPRSLVSSADFANLFPEDDAFYRGKEITIQNHSYGTVVESFYGNEAVAYDMSAISNPALLQVFSVGNSGMVNPATGMYAGISAMANLTGNFKQSKNGISVTALDSSGQAMPAASRGPAYDGRLKPELAAYGEDGSSGAAALVSGTAALVQDAFRKVNGQLPPSELVKAVLVNSANDIGAEGIDYITGYGSLNAYKAVEAVLQDRYRQDSLLPGETKTYSLVVPANISRLKLTMAWNDPPASPNAPTALVNDLDIVLKEVSSGRLWRPWVLNPTPYIDSLLLPAARKIDSLNNVEQVTIDAPAPGVYELAVSGARITTARQRFAISYQMDTMASFYWSYPTAADVLGARTMHTIRWSTTFSGSGDLQYSYDGVNWHPLATSVSLPQGQYKWTVPDTLAAALLRMQVGAQTILSDSFVISPQILLSVGFNCADSFLLYWNRIAGVQYQLYQLGEKYMEPVLVTSDTALVLHKQQYASQYYSIAPLVNGKEGFRGDALLYSATGVECYFLAFYLQSQTGATASFTAELGTLFNVRELNLQKLTPSGFATIQAITAPASTVFHLMDPTLLPGENLYRLQLMLHNGSILYSGTEKVYHAGSNPVYVYPNPVSHHEPLRIISTAAGEYTIRIMNSAGAEVYRQLITSSPASIQASRFPKGLYFAWVMDRQGKTFVQKLLVQ